MMAEVAKKAATKVAKPAVKTKIATKAAKAVKKPAAKAKVTKKVKEQDNGNIQETGQSHHQEVADEVVEAKPVAKAGKRSEKAIKEAEAEKEKASRKVAQSAVAESEGGKPKPAQKPPRTKLERRGKKFREVAKLIEAGKTYSLAEAVALAAKTSPVKFDATVELHVRLNIDPKRADQNIREVIALPAGTGKTVRVAVLAEEADAAKAKKAGADVAGHEDLLAQIEKGEINFDTLIATPAMMPKLGKHARVLGPKGLMPNPKSGTVTTDVVRAVEQAKAGRVEYRADSTGIVHVAIGKVSFGADKLLQNAQAVAASLKAGKPASVKGVFVQSVHLATSMGPSIPTSLE